MAASTGRFAGRVAIVTGAARGVGLATARRFVADGAVAVIADIDAEAIDAAIAGFGTGPDADRVLGIPTDVSDEGAVDAMVAQVAGRHGRVDFLVNNAGGAKAGSRWATVADSTLADWNAFLALNLTSAFLCSKAVLPMMTRQTFGRIVCISSISATNGQFAGAGYAAAKGGLDRARGLARQRERPARCGRQRHHHRQRATSHPHAGAPGIARPVGACRPRRRL